jgi:hypothetical protein
VARICYQAKSFSLAHRAIIDAANEICGEYAARGISITSRQLYYRFVARGLMPNRQSEANRLTAILSDARMAGEMDWDYLAGSRALAPPPRQDSLAAFITDAAASWRADPWAGQRHRVQLWVEKDAAVAAVRDVCYRNTVPCASCRGYLSLGEGQSAARQILRDIGNGDRVTILYVGDHDPIGLDMTRAAEEQLRLFVTTGWLAAREGARSLREPGAVEAAMREHMRERGNGITDNQAPWRLRRIALSAGQIDRYEPPPDPVRTVDSRLRAYADQTGFTEGWELEALDPAALLDLVQAEIGRERDNEAWAASCAKAEAGRADLARLSARWEHVLQSLRTGGPAAG